MYVRYALDHPNEARVVGVAEPRAFFRKRLAREHSIRPEHVAEDWRTLARLPQFADAVIIATQDALHEEPAIAFAQAGYDLLLEKPLAPNPEGCQRIVDAILASNAVFAVAHVLRYTPYTAHVKTVDFLTNTTTIPVDTHNLASSLMGHGGGDYGLMRRFVAAVAQREPGLILSGPRETHLTVFAAEQARREQRVIRVAI